MKVKAQFHNGGTLVWEGENLTFTSRVDDHLTYEIKRGSEIIAVLLQPVYITVVDEEEDADADAA